MMEVLGKTKRDIGGTRSDTDKMKADCAFVNEACLQGRQSHMVAAKDADIATLKKLENITVR